MNTKSFYIDNKSIGIVDVEHFIINFRHLFKDKDYYGILSKAAEYLPGDERERLVSALMHSSNDYSLKVARESVLDEIIEGMARKIGISISKQGHYRLADTWLKVQPNVISMAFDEKLMGYTLREVFEYMQSNVFLYNKYFTIDWNISYRGESLIKRIY